MKSLRFFSIALFLTVSLAAFNVHPATGPPREIKGADDAPMVLVPKGEFIMGSTPGTFIFGDNETPQRRVFLAAFYIDKYEVTNVFFNKRFALRSGYRGSFSGDRQPVVGVSWFQAKSYCASVKKRLPTEAEWEKAARGTDGRIYPWGGRPADCSLAVMGGTVPSCNKGYATWEVGSRPKGASPWGAMDMAGNVTEWVADRYDEKYYRRAPLKNPKGPEAGGLRVLKGGAWFNSSQLLRAAFRTGFAPESANHGIGFRCVKTLSRGFVGMPHPSRAMWAHRP
ncbi:MAG: SUMF1/EgtB/PvdO family nonheme iron enzyme [Nitrospinaceae bacterium]|jgi:formylglycine-generating enzyme required for sulfatase activity|nr:SUMF1/EgtB/PvdO family nonheme iron enzyme [Nitrospinaceae bacterium]MBT3433830.1 SUMF1/EgtB/PvdO family nonheme iron enzyme [Nitrospinaceae bacterium]MBT3821971.1 SUMF1/EgtB/PvdO family nonheme iron enzyme [Nitrospinaceae bacterium]MBT4429634.1 SUMF1/EgtB/PvdO family nonheme iron enzyme [Nitrospinaceae bacterium]MBT5369633.1 SUMF1/EgtB/PvdO family nonheme iron enzyme [Nitrospinaceae bacterium]